MDKSPTSATEQVDQRLPEAVTDTALITVGEHFFRQIDKIEENYNAIGDLHEEMRAYVAREKIAVTPEGDVIDDPGIIEKVWGIGIWGIERVGQSEIVSRVFPRSKEPENKRPQFDGVPTQLVSAAKLAARCEEDTAVPLTAEARAAFDMVRDWSQASPEELCLDVGSARKLLAPARKTGAIVNEMEVTDVDTVREYAEAIKQMPSPATIGYMVTRAYAATVNLLTGPKPAKLSVGLYSPSRRANLLQESGYSEEDFRLIEAARMLSLPFLLIDSDEKDLTTRVSHYNLVARTMGLNVSSRVFLGAKGMLGDMSSSRAVPDYAQAALAAQDVMEEITRVVTDPGFIRFAKHSQEFKDGNFSQTKQDKRAIAQVLTTSAKAGYSLIWEALEDNESITEDTILQALALEEAMMKRLEEVIVHMKGSGHLTKPIENELDALLTPQIGNYLVAASESDQLDRIEQFCEASQAQIDTIDQPYLYTSKKIRGFQGGVNTLRDISAELDKRQMLPEDEIRQTLAILLLQAENAEDKDLYFMQLKEDRHAIEELLGGMSYLGQDGSSRLTDALRWADEVINAGLDQKFAHARLKEFLTNYYLGGEDESLEPEQVAEPIIETLVEVETVEEEPAVEPAAEQAENAEERQNLIDEYFAELKDVLENVEVEFSDVKAFPPDGGSRREIKHHLERATGERFVDIDRSRLKGMVELKAEFERMGKSARLIFTSPTKWSKLPYFALYIQEQKDDEVGVCLLENVVNGLATYCFGVDGKEINSWEDMIGIASLKSARDDFGATPMVHPNKGAENFAQHYSVRLKNYAMLELAKVNQA